MLEPLSFCCFSWIKVSHRSISLWDDGACLGSKSSTNWAKDRHGRMADRGCGDGVFEETIWWYLLFRRFATFSNWGLGVSLKNRNFQINIDLKLNFLKLQIPWRETRIIIQKICGSCGPQFAKLVSINWRIAIVIIQTSAIVSINTLIVQLIFIWFIATNEKKTRN